MLNKELFIKSLPNNFIRSKRSEKIKTLNALVDECARRFMSNEHTAYTCATALRECNLIPKRESLYYRTAQSIRNTWPTRFANSGAAAPYTKNSRRLANKVYNGRMGNTSGSNDGYYFRGGGLVQTTGRNNFVKASKAMGFDFTKNPTAINELRFAVPLMVSGMIEGRWTGRKLSNYDRHNGDAVGFAAIAARAIVNGSDHAVEIAGNYELFLAAIEKSGGMAQKQHWAVSLFTSLLSFFPKGKTK